MLYVLQIVILFHPIDRDIILASLSSMSDIHFSCSFTIADSSVALDRLMDLILNRNTYDGESVNRSQMDIAWKTFVSRYILQQH
jgi:hypothetical protein